MKPATCHREIRLKHPLVVVLLLLLPSFSFGNSVLQEPRIERIQRESERRTPPIKSLSVAGMRVRSSPLRSASNRAALDTGGYARSFRASRYFQVRWKGGGTDERKVSDRWVFWGESRFRIRVERPESLRVTLSLLFSSSLTRNGYRDLSCFEYTWLINITRMCVVTPFSA